MLNSEGLLPIEPATGNNTKGIQSFINIMGYESPVQSIIQQALENGAIKNGYILYRFPGSQTDQVDYIKNFKKSYLEKRNSFFKGKVLYFEIGNSTNKVRIRITGTLKEADNVYFSILMDDVISLVTGKNPPFMKAISSYGNSINVKKRKVQMIYETE